MERDRIAIGSRIKNKRAFIILSGSIVLTMGSLNIVQIEIMATKRKIAYDTDKAPSQRYFPSK